MNPRTSSHSLTGVLALLGIAITLACWGTWGAARGSAAAIGSALSVINWVSLRYLVGRIISTDSAESASRAVFSLLLVAKMGALMGVIFILMHHFSVEPLGLVLGLGVLFVGPVLAALMLGNGHTGASTAGAAGEEQ